jgi:ribonuclease HI
MFDFEELLAVAYKKERMLSRRLAKGASLPEHDALLRTLTKSAGVRSLHELVEARRAALARTAEGQEARAARRTDRTSQRKTTPVSVDETAWHAWFDGSAMPNPGRIGLGGVLRSPSGETFEVSVAAGHGDCNVAEYLALIAVLETALREGVQSLSVQGDSRVVLDDLLKPEGEGIRALTHHAARVRALIAAIGKVRLQWIPRGCNADADALSRRALTAMADAA